MINDFKSFNYRLGIVEEKLNKLEIENSSEAEDNEFSSFSKNLINYNVLSKKKFFVAEFDVAKNKSIYINTQIDFSTQSKQKVFINLYANDKIFFNTSKTLYAGEQETITLSEYKSNKKEHIKFYVEIEPQEGILVIVKNISLFLLGLKKDFNKNEYNVIELKNEYLISITNNNSIFIKNIPKTNIELSYKQFEHLKSAISHSFVYIKENEKLYLFWVDIGNRLFCLDMDTKEKKFIDDNVTHVSATSNEDFILVSYIKNKSSIILEIRILKQFWTKIHVNLLNNSLISSLSYYNNYNEKFYIVLTDKNFSNYLIESFDESSSHGENVSANYSITVLTYSLNDIGGN